MESINPFTGRRAATYAAHSAPEIEAILTRAYSGSGEWVDLPIRKRIESFVQMAQMLRAQSHLLAKLMAEEMGKPVREGRAEVEKCAWLCDYYAEHAEFQLATEKISTEALESLVFYRPLGVVLAIMPWNFPFWQVFRFAVPGLISGNTAIVKHAPNTTGCALALDGLFADAGFPPAALQMLHIEAEEVPERVAQLIGDTRIAAVTLTGSTAAGRAVAATAGRHLKKTVLELGGSDPYVILDDADLEVAAEACVKGRLLNAGQSCIAAKRWIVMSSVYDTFMSRVKEMMETIRMGNPLDERTEMGPLARRDLLEKLDSQVRISESAGADIYFVGVTPSGEGFFYPPTILTNVQPGMPAYDEELFGPVAAVIRVENEKEACRVANDTSFGLGAAVFTNSTEKGREWAEKKLNAGSCFVNTFVRSDPRLPFGGIKSSGYGRELGPHGIREFVNVKTVVLT